MKNLVSALLISAIISIAVVGCTTVKSPDGSTTKMPDVALMQSTAKSAAFVGATIWLKGLGDSVPAHPQDRAAFVTTRDSLRVLIAAGSFSPGDLYNALQALPVKELKGEQGAIVVSSALVLWDAYGRKLAELDKDKVFDTYVLPVAQAIVEGLDQALGESK